MKNFTKGDSGGRHFGQEKVWIADGVERIFSDWKCTF